MKANILGDGSYDLRGATPASVDAAFEHYFANTPPQENTFLVDEPRGVIRGIRERFVDVVDDIRFWLF